MLLISTDHNLKYWQEGIVCRIILLLESVRENHWKAKVCHVFYIFFSLFHNRGLLMSLMQITLFSCLHPANWTFLFAEEQSKQTNLKTKPSY